MHASVKHCTQKSALGRPECKLTDVSWSSKQRIPMRQANTALLMRTLCSEPMTPMCCREISQPICKVESEWRKCKLNTGFSPRVFSILTFFFFFWGGWSQHTNLQLSQSESLLSRLLRDQRERLLGEGLRDQERDGGRRRSWEGLSWPRSTPSDWPAAEWEGEGLRRRILPSSVVSSITTVLPRCRLGEQPCSSSLRLFLIRVLLRWKRPWRLERASLGLGERDQDSVSEDGGRTVSVGTGTGCDRVTPSGPAGEDVVIVRA